MSDSNSAPTHEQITRRAYEIYIERGQPEGQDLAHWLEAERQLRAAGQAKTSTSSSAQVASTPTANPPMRATTPTQSNGRSNGRSPSRATARK